MNAIPMLERCGRHQVQGWGADPPREPERVDEAPMCSPPVAHVWPAGRTAPGCACACGDSVWPEWGML